MKYLVSALCVMYLPVHAFAESLQDNTNAALPNIPEVSNAAFRPLVLIKAIYNYFKYFYQF